MKCSYDVTYLRQNCVSSVQSRHFKIFIDHGGRSCVLNVSAQTDDQFWIWQSWVTRLGWNSSISCDPSVKWWKQDFWYYFCKLLVWFGWHYYWSSQHFMWCICMLLTIQVYNMPLNVIWIILSQNPVSISGCAPSVASVGYKCLI